VDSAGGFAGRVDVPNRGTAQYRTGGTAQRLEETAQHQGFDIGSERTADAGNGKQQKPANHNGLAAKPIRQRAADQLRQGKAQHVQAQCQLNLIRTRLEIAPDLRQCGQVHIGSQRPKSHSGGE